jgi:phage/plasmid-like protein (TIGR03299 family)
MSHLFSSGLFFGQRAWHGLGVTLPEDSKSRFSIDESIRLAGLDWQVETRPLYLANGQELDGYNAIVRTDNSRVLGVVSDRYRPLQNREHFEWFRPFLESREVAFETCGALKDGAMVWVLAKIQRPDAEITPGDSVAKYLLLASSHDGSAATSVGFCPIRVVCWNTLSAALGDQRSMLLKVRHTANQKSSLAVVRETINLVDQTFESTAAQYRRLAQAGISHRELRQYVRRVLELPEDEKLWSSRSRNTLNDIVKLACSGPGNDGRTVWSAYNGITHYVTHVHGRNADSRLRGNWFGAGKAMNERALKLALQLAS